MKAYDEVRAYGAPIMKSKGFPQENKTNKTSKNKQI